jgi:hexosaminidase
MAACALMDLVPLPRAAVRHPGMFALDDSTRLAAERDAAPVGGLLHDLLRLGTGLPLPVTSCGDSGERAITLKVRPGLALPEHGYHLEVRPDRVEVLAGEPGGLVMAVQTLRQLLPPETLRAAPSAGPLAIPCCVVRDAPRCQWRGVMVDVARHFMPKSFLLRMVDLAALHKLNVLHLHLTDDQGWRLEVPSWPRLTELGSWRRETARGRGKDPGAGDGKPHGGYYSLADLREIVEYAARRHIMVVPEVGIPGHVQAAIAAYPELGVTGPHPVRTTWGGSPHTLAPGDLTARFVTDVLDTVIGTFPSPYVHIGGDECQKQEWRADQGTTDWCERHGLPSTDALQSWFLRFAVDYLAAKGRRAVAWDQAMEDGGVPSDVIIMCWRDWAAEDVLSQALAAGHDVVYCPTAYTYLDHDQSQAPEEPIGFPELTTLDDVAAFDPVPSTATAKRWPGRIVGTQAHLWSEHTPTPREVEYMAFPRLGALAEAAWTDIEARSRSPFCERLAGYLARLDALSVEYRPLDGPLPWQRRCSDPDVRGIAER